MRHELTRQELALAIVPIACLLMACGVWSYNQRPYQDLIARYVTSLAARSPAQRENIRAAARRLDGAVVAPGADCSFNALVGPRTLARGFCDADAFMEGTLTRSVGGGVCQVSSTLYAALQETTLPIVRRVPHFAVVASVPPGRDATVWYGHADLIFKNSFDRPLRVRARDDGLALRVELWGNAEPGQRAALRFVYRYGPDRKQRVVCVYRRANGQDTRLSQDVYRLP